MNQDQDVVLNLQQVAKLMVSKPYKPKSTRGILTWLKTTSM